MIGRLKAYLFYARLACNLLPLVAFAIAEFVRFSGYFVFWSSDYDPVVYFHLLLVATLVWSLVAEHYHLVDEDETLVERSALRRVTAACGATYMILFAALFFYRELSFSRVFLTISGVSLFLCALLMRAGVRRWVRTRAQGRHAIRILVVGADDFAARAVSRLLALGGPACYVVGYVRLPGQEVQVTGAPVFELEQLDELAMGDRMDDVIVAIPPARWEQVGAVMPAIERLSAPVRAILDLGPGIVIQNHISHLGPVSLLDLTATPLDTIHYFLFKRAVDIVLAIFLLVITAPVMLVIALAIRLTSPGPVFFVQDRVGLNGKVFRMYKFRTMRVVLGAESDTRWTTPHDARCTRLGWLLRRSSLDELPQFFNVLKGEMSVVGPRPERPYFVRKFLQDVARYNSRHRLKVGMTGWAQVNGWRGDTSIRERVEHDLYYLQHWSLGLDLRIMLMTIWAGLFGKNAY
jgi:Undecaprenyl-phosphate glucose phosphotransferase